jgi:dTDP-4-amino-4,6-dideoxygalactose transaminase
MGYMCEGDEIIVPANTYIASILAITDNRLVPIFVEPNIDTYQIDDTLIEKAISNKTKAIMIVHLYGQCAYTEKIGRICKERNLKLIEDNSQAHGCVFTSTTQESDGKVITGSIGDAAGHSFYPGKNLGALGDAGAVTTDNKKLAEVVRSLANYGSTKKYVCDYQGLNSRLDEIQAAFLRIKLSHLNEEIKIRQEIALYYINHIKHPDIVLPKIANWDAHVFHLFTIRSSRRDELQKYLSNLDIQTLIHYPIPPHKQACYSQWNHLELPITERIHQEELSLPMSPVLSFDEIIKVTKAINSF